MLFLCVFPRVYFFPVVFSMTVITEEIPSRGARQNTIDNIYYIISVQFVLSNSIFFCFSALCAQSWNICWEQRLCCWWSRYSSRGRWRTAWQRRNATAVTTKYPRKNTTRRTPGRNACCGSPRTAVWPCRPEPPWPSCRRCRSRSSGTRQMVSSPRWASIYRSPVSVGRPRSTNRVNNTNVRNSLELLYWVLLGDISFPLTSVSGAIHFKSILKSVVICRLQSKLSLILSNCHRFPTRRYDTIYL